MEIFGFLLGLGCLVVLTWAISLLGNIVFGRKHRRRMRSHEQPPTNILEFREQERSAPNLPIQPVSPRRVIAATEQPLAETRVRLPSSRHQQNIRRAELILKRLRDRSTIVELPEALGILRKMNPYAFEELLLNCCQGQGWEIRRNFRYSNDGGIDGRVSINGKLYLIQAKRYSGYIKPQHIQQLHQVIRGAEVAGGFFIHTGKTGKMSKELLREYQISLLSGQRLIDFVLGLRLKILG